MIKEMESIVNECLKQHEGGEKFFDAIDENLRNDNLLITMMIDKVGGNEKFDYILKHNITHLIMFSYTV